MKLRMVGLAVTSALVLGTPHGTALGVTYEYLASVSGATASDGRPDNGTANFLFNPSFTQLSVTLTNTAAAGQLGGISSVLDGLSFSLSGAAGSALSLLSLSDPSGTADCTTSACTFSSTPVNLATSGWTYSGGTGLLAAGSGSFKPYGVVNNNITRTDGIPNGQHNPYLVGPVTFTFSIVNPTNTEVGVTAASLYFGTGPDIHVATISPVPEPGAVLLLTAGLGVIMMRVRRARGGGAWSCACPSAW